MAIRKLNWPISRKGWYAWMNNSAKSAKKSLASWVAKGWVASSSKAISTWKAPGSVAPAKKQWPSFNQNIYNKKRYTTYWK